jgi:hypothetical protein
MAFSIVVIILGVSVFTYFTGQLAILLADFTAGMLGKDLQCQLAAMYNLCYVVSIPAWLSGSSCFHILLLFELLPPRGNRTHFGGVLCDGCYMQITAGNLASCT